MLILQRRTGESLVIGEDIRVSVVSIEGGRVRLAISAPPEVSILRSELLDAKLAEEGARRAQIIRLEKKITTLEQELDEAWGVP